jgi:hypothetical protein
MTIQINWATIFAVLSGLGGVVGLIVTPIWGTHLASEVQTVIVALSGLLVSISGYHATKVVSTTATAKRLGALATAGVIPPAEKYQG